MLTAEQKHQIRKGLRKVTTDRIGFVRWMVRIMKAGA